MTSFFSLLKTGSLTGLALLVTSAAFAGGDCHGPTCHSDPLSYYSRTRAYVPVYRHVPAYEDYAVRYGHLPASEVICSTSLGCELRIEPVRLSNWGTFTCARLISTPSANSCLAGLGLVKGDLITRLGGVRVTRGEHLDCGSGELTCRYICLRDGIVREATIATTVSPARPATTELIAPPPVPATPPSAPVEVAPAPPTSPELPAVATVAVAPAPPVEVAPAPASVGAP